MENKRIIEAQGAVEYLLLLAAGVVVVAVVITFLINATTAGQGAGCQQLNTYLCDTLHSKTDECACYIGPGGKWPDDTNVDEYMNDNHKVSNFCCITYTNCAALTSKWNCT
ncbi:MAG: hypothetical protein NTZ73_04200 [Candidatus Diapherotrites archaeon]|nr:hypothetical protein [Candidatus Diapherotrites archaeon]